VSPDPLSGSAVRITITIDGRPIVDTDLTTLYLRAKLGGGRDVLPIDFMPFVPPEETEPEDTPEPVLPVRGTFIFRIEPQTPHQGVFSLTQASKSFFAAALAEEYGREP
jgi:hypothetical protein